MPVDPLIIAQLAGPLPPGGTLPQSGVAAPPQSSFTSQQQQVNSALSGVTQGQVSPAYGSGNTSTVLELPAPESARQSPTAYTGGGRSAADISALGYAATSSGGNVGGVIGKGPEEFKTVQGAKLSAMEKQGASYDLIGDEGYTTDEGDFIDPSKRGGNKAIQKAYKDDKDALEDQLDSGEITKDEFKIQRKINRKSKKAAKKTNRQNRRGQR